MDWRITTAAAVFVGLASGIVCAKEYGAFRATTSVAASSNATAGAVVPVGTASFPDVANAGRGPGPNDPAMELLATNPYEAQLSPYRTALNIDGDTPLLEEPYEDTKRFVNPYENSVGIANPYVDALRDSERGRQALLNNPYTARLRDEATLLQNPYARRR